MRSGYDGGTERDPLDETGGCLDGTVGWDDEEGIIDNDSSPQDKLRDISLIRVTLYRGRNADVDGALPDDGLAHGRQILCRLSTTVQAVPKKGTQVQVMFAAGRLLAPGGGVIVSEYQPQLINVKEGERVIWATEGFSGLRIKKDGLSFFTSADGTKDGPLISFQAGKKGFVWNYPDGRMTLDDTGFNVITSSGAELHLGPAGMPAPLDSMSSRFSIAGALVDLSASGITLGTMSGVPEPFAKATTLQALLSLLTSYVTALEAHIAATTAYINGPPATPPAPLTTAAGALNATWTPEVAAAAALAAGVAASTTTLPSGSTMGT